LTAGIYVKTFRQSDGNNRPICRTSCLHQRVPPGYMTRHTAEDMHTTSPRQYQPRTKFARVRAAGTLLEPSDGHSANNWLLHL